MQFKQLISILIILFGLNISRISSPVMARFGEICNIFMSFKLILFLPMDNTFGIFTLKIFYNI